MCCDDILMPAQNRTVLCNLLWRGNEEGGAERGGGLLHSFLLIFSKHAIPVQAEDNEKWLRRVGGSQVQPPMPLLWGSNGLDEPTLCWVPGHGVTRAFSMLSCPLRRWCQFSGMFSTWVYFEDCHHLQTQHVALPYESGMCVFQKHVVVKILCSSSRKIWMKIWLHLFLVSLDRYSELSDLWLSLSAEWGLSLSAEWGHSCLRTTIVEGTKCNTLRTVPGSH